MTRATAAAALCLSSLVALAAGEAAACVNETVRNEAANARILDARAYHDQGLYLRAAAEVRRVSVLDIFDVDVRARIYEVLALSAIRSRGEVDPDLLSLQRTPDDAERVARVEKAVRHLEERLATDRRDVVELRAALAEGYWLLGDVDRAKTIFDELLRDDVVPSPQTWSAIAYLRAARGDPEGAEAAQTECETLSGGGKTALCPLTKDFPAPSPGLGPLVAGRSSS